MIFLNLFAITRPKTIYLDFNKIVVTNAKNDHPVLYFPFPYF